MLKKKKVFTRKKCLRNVKLDPIIFNDYFDIHFHYLFAVCFRQNNVFIICVK